MDGVLYQVLDLFVAFDGDGDDSAAAGGDLLNVGEGFLPWSGAKAKWNRFSKRNKSEGQSVIGGDLGIIALFASFREKE